MWWRRSSGFAGSTSSAQRRPLCICSDTTTWSISTSGVWRILKKAGLNRLPASQRYKRRSIRWRRYEKQRPGHQLQVDVKFIEPVGRSGRKKRYHHYTAIGDCTRLRVLRAYARNGGVRSGLPLAPARQGHGDVRIKPRTRGSTARLNDRTLSTRRSSTTSCKARSSTTSTSSTANCMRGRTTTTTVAPTAPSPARAIRTPTAESPRPTVIGARQSHSHRRLASSRTWPWASAGRCVVVGVGVPRGRS